MVPAYFMSPDSSANGKPAWAIWQRCNRGQPTQFEQRVYVLEQVGTRQRPAWRRNAFVSGGWWSWDTLHDTREEALASLAALCERLNQPL